MQNIYVKFSRIINQSRRLICVNKYIYLNILYLNILYHLLGTNDFSLEDAGVIAEGLENRKESLLQFHIGNLYLFIYSILSICIPSK